MIKSRNAALTSCASCLHAFSNPNLFLRQQLISLCTDHGLLGELVFFGDLILCKVTGITSEATAVELQNTGGNAIQKSAIVRDGHHAAFKVNQELLEPSDRVQVQVVGGLI